jgi:L-seryl-tRNA(Ser) seleniumtransferase
VVSEEIAAGAAVVTFSGDKLLGGPQAGILVGRADVIDAMKKNPLARALRVDKFTLAALEATLKCYLDMDTAAKELPTLRMLLSDRETLRSRADSLAGLLKPIKGLLVSQTEGLTMAGGGSLPGIGLPACLVCVRPIGMDASELADGLRKADPVVVCFVRDDTAVFDVRTFQKGEMEQVAAAVEAWAGEHIK